MIILLVSLAVTACYADVGNIFDDGDIDIGSSGGDGDSDGLFGIIIWLLIDHPAVGLPLLIIAVIILIVKSRHSKKTPNQAPFVSNSTVNAGTFNGQNMTEPQVLAKIREKDPSFSAEEFKSFVSSVFIKVQEAWESKKWETVRPFESDSMFKTHRQQLDEYIVKKQTNHMDRQCVLGCLMTYYNDDGKNETITVRLNATLLDYVTDDETGKIVSGSDTERRNRFYKLSFVRTSGVKTEDSHDMSSNECPSCGAPISISATGICEYCKNVVTSGNYGWVLNEYARW